MFRSTSDITEKIVGNLGRKNDLWKELEAPFVVGSLKEGTRVFSLGRT